MAKNKYDDLLVGYALKEFYGANYLGDEIMTDKINWFGYGYFKIPYPNVKMRRELIYLHDLTHVITGYGTTFVEAGELAAWEIASGFPSSMWVGYVYPPLAFIVGFILSPRRVIQAFKKGRGQNNLYKLGLPKEEMVKKTISELKDLIDFKEIA